MWTKYSYSGKSRMIARARIAKVARRGDLALGGKAVGVDVARLRHAETLRGRVHFAEKPSIEPPTPSASTTAMSFADFTSIIFSALSTVTCVPDRKPIFEGDCEAAIGDTVNSVSSVMRPCS